MSRRDSDQRAWGSFAKLASILLCGCFVVGGGDAVSAQDVRYGDPVSAATQDVYRRGLDYLVKAQARDGSWSGAGVTAICTIALLSSGEDPNFGPYATSVQRGTRFLLSKQADNGYVGRSMYEHGFAMLAFAELYGAVDDELLAADGSVPRTLAEALELACRCAITSQSQNPSGAWRYQPDTKEADTSVSGAVLVGLLAARNAGIEIPDTSIDKAISYFRGCSASNGSVSYIAGGGSGHSGARTAIAALVYSIAKRTELPAYEATKRAAIANEGFVPGMHPCYYRYYMAQALFQCDYSTWNRWTAENTRLLATWQKADGSILSVPPDYKGEAYTTGMLLLSAALEYCLLPIYER